MKPCFHVVFLLVLAGLPCHTLADSGRSLVLNVSTGGYPPYTIIEDDRIHGLMWEVMAAFAEDQELTLVGREVPTKRVVSEFQAGIGDKRTLRWVAGLEQGLSLLPDSGIRGPVPLHVRT